FEIYFRKILQMEKRQLGVFAFCFYHVIVCLVGFFNRLPGQTVLGIKKSHVSQKLQVDIVIFSLERGAVQTVRFFITVGSLLYLLFFLIYQRAAIERITIPEQIISAFLFNAF